MAAGSTDSSSSWRPLSDLLSEKFGNHRAAASCGLDVHTPEGLPRRAMSRPTFGFVSKRPPVAQTRWLDGVW
jgi:hypothetical protein